MPRADRYSESIGDYLKAIFEASRDGPARSGDIAERMGLTRASVSGMLSRLAELGLIEHRPYKGATLTEAGTREALKLVRRHRVVETFMIRHLGYTWDEVHGEAEAIEHAIGERFTERLSAFLGHPEHDPHGDPIPTASGVLPDTPDEPLASVQPGGRLVVARLRSRDPEVLAYLATKGIEPGVVLEVVAAEPHGGVLEVRRGTETFALSESLAGVVRGRMQPT
jgi:DtxR family Mn-dependent transcriptional regulator